MKYHSVWMCLCSLAVILIQLSCDQDSQESEQATLDWQKELILTYMQTGVCTGGSECRFIGLGSKQCGGPKQYVVYSTSLDTAHVIEMITNYNTMEDAYNRKWGLSSDCSLPPPPDSVRCVDGRCAGYWNGEPH